MSESLTIRPLVVTDLPYYKQMRDDMLLAHPEAFSSDAAAEKNKEPADYLYRLGIDRRSGGHFLLGAWRGARIVGAIGCERELRLKVQHIGHVVGMMVRPEARGRGVGHDLLEACIAEARQTPGLEMLTLTVTVGNTAAIRLYERCGFIVYGTLPRALRIGRVYHDKLHMALTF
jgi:RimJ/RimL family protein N-acetyltransferase